MSHLLRRWMGVPGECAPRSAEALAAPGAHVPHKDYEGAKTGMWLFLFTELLLFGGLFLVYSVLRAQYAHEFHLAAAHLNRTLGVANTFVLLTSSLTMVLAVTALQKGDRESTLNTLVWTLFLAGVFLVIKSFEWGAKFHHGIWPGSEELGKLPAGEGLFYSLYFVMTGLHGLHVVIGMVLLSVVALRVRRGSVHSGDFVLLENAGLYWHLVDLVWIFLLPLFYLTN